MADTPAASSGSSKQLGAKQCAASMAGVPVRIEYDTGSDDGVPFVHLHAVHLRGVRVPIDWFSDAAISDWQHEAECAEITADECDEPRHITTRGGVQCAGEPDMEMWRRAA